MNKAIGLIDNDLIKDAANYKKRQKGKIISFYSLGALAACLLLIVVLTFMLTALRKPAVSVNGEKLEGSLVLQGESLSVRSAAALPLTAELEIKLHKTSEVSVSEGHLSVLSGDNYEYKGESFEAKGDIKLLWNIDSPDNGKTYTLSIGNEAFAKVSFDSGRNVWMISEQ